MEDIRLKEEMLNYMEDKDSTDLIEVLHKAQRLWGYIPKEVIKLICETIRVPESKVYGVVTFYTAFSLVPKGKYSINVCLGTACYVKGAEQVLEEVEDELGIKVKETTEDQKFSIVDTRCVGDCAAAPVVIINDDVYSHVEVDDVKEILAQY